MKAEPAEHSAPRTNRFSRNPGLTLAILTLVLILLLEGLAQIALFVRDSMVQNAELSPLEKHIEALKKADGIDAEIMTREMQVLYQDSILFHPGRWYRLPGNFSGQYFQTDALGFRFRPEEANGGDSLIACFGGSTQFSIYTRQEGTLPHLMNELNLVPQGWHALNMGVGAYGSSPELEAFRESIQRYPIREAIFLDGVNEVTRYLERFMYHPGETIYDYHQYAYGTALNLAYRNFLRSSANEYELVPKSTWRPALYWVAVSIVGKIKRLLPAPEPQASTEAKGGWTNEEYEQAGKTAAAIYLNNIRDIAAIARERGIRVWFVLQPTLFSAKRELTPMELEMRDNNHPFVAAIHEATYRHIREADKNGLNFIDLSDGWDDLPKGEYFYDWHHVNSEGNKHLARKIAEKVYPPR